MILIINFTNRSIVFSTTCLAFLILVKFSNVRGYPDGAPPRLCESMLPSHGEQSMTSDMPFQISLDKKFIRGADSLTITVTSKDPSRCTLAGVLFIMKQPNNKRQSFGTFDPTKSDNDLKTVACFGKQGSGITHSHASQKTSLMFQWSAPNVTSGDYELHATLVRDFNHFWANYILPDKIWVRSDAPPPTLSAAGFITAFQPLLLAAFLLANYSIFNKLKNCLQYQA